MSKNIIDDEIRLLSDGSEARVSHIGRMYFYSRQFLNPAENPSEHVNFTGKGAKGQAMAMLETALKNDVLETED